MKTKPQFSLKMRAARQRAKQINTGTVGKVQLVCCVIVMLLLRVYISSERTHHTSLGGYSLRFTVQSAVVKLCLFTLVASP